MDDFDFDSESRLGRKGGQSGRRAQQPADDDNLDDILESFSQNTKPQPLPRKSSIEMKRANGDESPNEIPQQAVSGWGENGANRPTRRRDAGASIEFSQNLFSTSKNVDGVNQREFDRYNEDTENIPEIPDLEDNETESTEDMAFQVAEAPDVQVHQISTYKELDKEFFREKAFQFLEGNIDVSLLHCGLNTENQIAEEEDVIWEWTKLFTEVVSVLSVAKEQEESTEDNLFGEDKKPKQEEDIFASVTSRRHRDK